MRRVSRIWRARRLASMGMRDYRSAIRTHVVLFDGGMGATLEQFDLSLEDDYKLPGRAHEALVLNRPDVIEGVHASFVEAGADVVQTDTFQASRLKLDEWGLGDTRSRSTAAARRSRARPPARSASSPARSARPATCPRPTTRRSATSPSARCATRSPSSASASSRAASTSSSSRPRRTSSRSRPRSSARARR